MTHNPNFCVGIKYGISNTVTIVFFAKLEGALDDKTCKDSHWRKSTVLAKVTVVKVGGDKASDPRSSPYSHTVSDHAI